jgi:hypothetical protein
MTCPCVLGKWWVYTSTPHLAPHALLLHHSLMWVVTLATPNAALGCHTAPPVPTGCTLLALAQVLIAVGEHRALVSSPRSDVYYRMKLEDKRTFEAPGEDVFGRRFAKYNIGLTRPIYIALATIYSTSRMA